MSKYLLIVESPSKAKTIKKYFGKDRDVVASMGHIEDLPEKKFGVDLKNFEPEYVTISGKKKLISELKKLVQKYDKVYIGTDPDREGEAIARHLVRVLDLPDDTPRVVFHEITKKAIQEAIKNPRQIDLNLVNAQQTRRILDRIVGYKLSPLLREKIKRGLSAGRVQSVAVKLIVEKENEIKNFNPKSKWEIKAKIIKEISEENLKKLGRKNEIENPEIEIKLMEMKGEKIEFKDEKQVKEFFQKIGIKNKIKETIKRQKLSPYHEVEAKISEVRKKLPFKLIDVEKKQSKKSPPVPFITSTLQQAASNAFGRGVKKVMQIAQRLYEKGFITYMRTDSPSLSDYALGQIEKYILQNFGKEFLDLKQYKAKSKSAQEAHEAIRPTDIFKSAKDLKLSSEEAKLYELIRTRTSQSQMPPAVYDVQLLKFQIDFDLEDIWETKIEVLSFPGWKILEEQTEKEIRSFEKLDIFYSKKVIAQQGWNKPPSRYTEASLVKKLEQLGIGRPSTYATIISTIQKRGYVEKKDKKLVPTDIAFVVTDYLDKRFIELMDYDFTANMEDFLDKIALGKFKRKEILRNFWIEFKKYLDEASKDGKIREYVGEKCPNCGGELIYKWGKNGKFIACENYPECRYKRQTEEELLYEQKLKEEFEGKPCPAGGTIVVKKSKNGYFLASSEYPKIKWTMSPDIYRLQLQLGEKVCPKCGKGKLVVRRGKRGYFVGCDRYPECNYIERLKV